MTDPVGDQPAKHQVKIAATKVVRLTREEVAAEFSNESGSDSEDEESPIKSSQKSKRSSSSRYVNDGPLTGYIGEGARKEVEFVPFKKPDIFRNIPVHYKELGREIFDVEVCSAIS